MNILFLDQHGTLGGGQLCLLDLIPAVLEQNWSATAAVPINGPLALRLRDAGARVFGLEQGKYRSSRKSLSDAFRFAASLPQQLHQLEGLCRDGAIDLLYVNGPRLLLHASLLRWQGPVIFHSHSYLPAGPSRSLSRWAIRRRNMHVIAVSDIAASWLKTSSLRIVSNGVAAVHRDRGQGSPSRIGFVGRVCAEKGIAQFMKASELVRTPCAFRVFGEPRLPGLSTTEFRGWRYEPSHIYSELDLLVVPSMVEEAFGRNIIEAFSAGIPVVAFRSGAIPQLVEDNVTGFLTRNRTAEALAERIDEVLSAPDLARKVAAAAYRVWEERYTLRHYQNNLVQAIASIAQESAKAQRRQ